MPQLFVRTDAAGRFVLTPEEAVIDAEYWDAEVPDGESTEEGGKVFRKRDDAAAVFTFLLPPWSLVVAMTFCTVLAWRSGEDAWIVETQCAGAAFSLAVAVLFSALAVRWTPSKGSSLRLGVLSLVPVAVTIVALALRKYV